MFEGRLRELANIQKLEVAEPIQLQEARAQNLKTARGKWLDDVKGTPEYPEAVRSRLIATQVNTHAPRGCHAGDTTNHSVQNHCESSCNEKQMRRDSNIV